MDVADVRALIIREFERADLERVQQLWRTSGLALGPSDSGEEVGKKLQRDPDLFLVAQEAGEVVGSVMGAWDGRRAWVYHLCVDPSSRRRGVGRALMAELERRVRAKGALRMSLLVHKGNQGAIDFYKAVGFEISGDLMYARKTLA